MEKLLCRLIDIIGTISTHILAYSIVFFYIWVYIYVAIQTVMAFNKLHPIWNFLTYKLESISYNRLLNKYLLSAISSNIKENHLVLFILIKIL